MGGGILVGCLLLRVSSGWGLHEHEADLLQHSKDNHDGHEVREVLLGFLPLSFHLCSDFLEL